MQRWLLEQLKLFFGDIRKSIATVVVVLVLGGTVGVVCLPKTTLHALAQLLGTPTPIWATIAAVLLCYGYTYYTHLRSRPTSVQPPIESGFTCEISVSTDCGQIHIKGPNQADDASGQALLIVSPHQIDELIQWLTEAKDETLPQA